MLVVRKKRRAKIRVAVWVQLPGSPCDVKVVEIEDTRMDKMVPNVLMDRRSGLNILPTQTMGKKDFSLTWPSPFIINMANQSLAVPLGHVKDSRICIGGEKYVVTFHVIRMHSTNYVVRPTLVKDGQCGRGLGRG